MNINKKNKMIASAVVVLVAVAGVAFYGGMAYAKGTTRGMNTAFGPGAQAGAGFGAGAGRTTGARTGGFAGMGGATAGKVIAKDDKSITVQLATGGSKIVFITPATPVSKDAVGTLSDVVVGTEVIVAGAANADGSISAQTIRIGSAMMMRGTTPSAPASSASPAAPVPAGY